MKLRLSCFIVFSFFSSVLLGQDNLNQEIKNSLTVLDSMQFYSLERDILPYIENIQKKLGGKSIELDLFIANYYIINGKDSIAIKVLEQNKNITEVHQDSSSLLFAKFLQHEGFQLQNTNNYDKAFEKYERSNEIIIEKLGKENSFYLNNLYYQAQIKGEFQELQEAKEILYSGIDISKSIKHPLLGPFMNYLSEMHLWGGEFKEAEQVLLQSIDIVYDQLGEQSVSYEIALNNISMAYQRLGNYEKAEELMQRSLDICKKYRGKDNQGYESKLSNIIEIYLDLNNYTKAEDYLAEYTEIIILKHGKESSQYIYCLNLKSGLSSEIGQFDSARDNFLEAIALNAKINGKDNVENAILTNNLAHTYYDLTEYQKAIDLWFQTSEFIIQQYGEQHFSYASNLASIASAYGRLEDFENALVYSKKSLALKKEIYGEKNRRYADGLHSLAFLYANMEQPQKAEKLYLQSLEITQEIYGEDHSIGAITINNLGFLYMKLKQYEKAETYIQKSISEKKKKLEYAFSFMSEKEKETYFYNEIRSFGLPKHFALEYQSKNSKDQVYEVLLLEKGLKLNSNLQTKSFILKQEDTVILQKYNELIELKKEYRKQYLLPIAKRDTSLNIQSQIENLEKVLARESAEYRSEEEMNKVTKNKIAEKLNEHEVAIEFSYVNVDITRIKDSIVYTAAILDPNGNIHYVPLCMQQELENKLNISTKSSDQINKLYGHNKRGVVTQKEASRSLYDMIWKPIDSLLLDVQKIYYSPSGLLNRININAIAINDEEVLSDKYDMNCLMSTRNIAVPKEVKTNNTTYVMGGIDYNLTDHTLPMDEESDNPQERSSNLSSWQFLKWTQNESDFINEKLIENGFSSNYKTGQEATEEDFKKLSEQASPRFVHLATHGYFYPEPKEEEEEASGNLFQQAESPLLRSGLILSGGNHVWLGNDPIEDKEDGVLTASEISNMNLSNTELVVLSACDTGLGDIEGAEGVYGLQRAFKMAGTKYIIMSLWQVPDRATSEFMQSFYKNLLDDDNQDIRAAFNKTQLEMRDRFYEHHLWAGFVLIE